MKKGHYTGKRKVFKAREPKPKLRRDKMIGVAYELLERAARAGLTNEQIAYVCGVSRATLQKWIARDKKAAKVMRKGKEEPNLKVENSLFRRALGYNIVEVTERVKTNGGGEIILKVPLERKHKHVPASVRAIEMWLYNRDPDRWKKQATLNVRNMSLKDKTELARSAYGEDDD